MGEELRDESTTELPSSVGLPTSARPRAGRRRLADLAVTAAGRRLDYAKAKRNDVKREADAREAAESWQHSPAVGVFRADFPGWCPACSKGIKRNDPIRHDDDLDKYVHNVCSQPRGLRPRT